MSLKLREYDPCSHTIQASAWLGAVGFVRGADECRLGAGPNPFPGWSSST